MDPTILVATWDSGIFVVDGTEYRQELAGQGVRSMVQDGRGGVLAIAGGDLMRRGTEWVRLASSESSLSCCTPLGD